MVGGIVTDKSIFYFFCVRVAYLIVSEALLYESS